MDLCDWFVDSMLKLCDAYSDESDTVVISTALSLIPLIELYSFVFPRIVVAFEERLRCLKH